MDFEVSFSGGQVKDWPRWGPVVVGWPTHMPLPRIGEGVSIDTTNLLIHRGDGDWSSQSPRAQRIDGAVGHVRIVRSYDERATDRVKWLVEVTFR